MPRVPVYKKQQQTQSQGFPTVPIGPSPTIAAQRDLAGAVGDIADLFAAREVQRKDENDKINVSQLYYGPGGFKDQIRKISTAAKSTTGKASENVGNDFVSSYDELQQKMLQSDAIENDEQRLLFNALALRGRASAINPIASHQATQHQLRKKEAAEAVIVDAYMSVTEDPRTLNESLEAVEIALTARGGDISKELFETEKKLKEIAEETILKNLSDATWNTAMPMSLEDGEAFIKSSGLPRENINKMLDDYRDEKTIQENRADDEIKQAQLKTANEFDQKLNVLGIAEVETSNLEPGKSWGQKDYYRDKIAKRAEKIEKDKTDPFNEFDPATKSDLQKRANVVPEGLTNDDIWQAVGNGKDGGITAEQAQAIQTRRDTNLAKVDKGKRNGQAHKMIDGLETKKVFNVDDPAQNIFDAQRWRDALDQHIDENPEDDPVKWAQENVVIPSETGFFQKIFANPALSFIDEVPTDKKLTHTQAQSFLKQADGDKEKARQLAKEAGLEF